VVREGRAVTAVEPEYGRLDRIPAADLRTPEVWARLLGWRVVDPDGWRGADGRPWDDPIGRDEFERRANLSTCQPPELLRSRVGDLERQVQRLVAERDHLAAECAALADALGAATHEFRPRSFVAERSCCRTPSGEWVPDEMCKQPPEHPVHRTPAVVRAELGNGA
jgi:hypothetical protein